MKFYEKIIIDDYTEEEVYDEIKKMWGSLEESGFKLDIKTVLFVVNKLHKIYFTEEKEKDLDEIILDSVMFILNVKEFYEIIKEIEVVNEEVKEYKEIAINAIQKNSGDCEDDYNRYKLRFRGLSEAQLNNEYGQSGKTCREILNECIKQDEKINKTIEWIKSI